MAGLSKLYKTLNLKGDRVISAVLVRGPPDHLYIVTVKGKIYQVRV